MSSKALIIMVLAIVLSVALLSLVYMLSTSGKQVVLRVSTTTSLYATGLLDRLADEFSKEHPNIVVQFIAVGSGEALRKAELGDADLVLVHAPSLERKYLEKGVIYGGRIFAYNYFVIVGPKNDPANIAGLDPIEAMKKIYEAGEKGYAKFVSRGDNSGTHVRELMLWRKAGLNPKGKPWYIETGSGMSQTLMVAHEYAAYTLSDIGTYLKFSSKLTELKVLVDKGDILVNIYSAYLVRESKNEKYAKKFIDFIVSDKGQEIISSYGGEEFGRPLFYPVKIASIEELKRMWNELAEE